MDQRVIEYAEYLRGLHAARNTMFNKMEQMYLVEWADEADVKKKLHNAKITKSPDPRNTLLGAVRLMVATEPEFTVPRDQLGEGIQDDSSKLETAAKTLWTRAGRLRQAPVHYDLVLSALLFSEMHIAITCTADTLAFNSHAPKQIKRRMEQIAAYTPFTYDIWDPRTGYPEFGPYGLARYYREVITTANKVLDEFGEPAVKALANMAYSSEVTLCHWWDYEKRITWIKNFDTPLIEENRDDPYLPIVVQLGEGSLMFQKPEDQRQPFLFTLEKAGLWERMNLALTVMNTAVFSFAANPTYFERVNNPDKHLLIDYNIPGFKVTLGPGEEFGPVNKAAIDPSLMQMMQVTQDKIPESTMHGQALGQPMGGSTAYSTIALLNQAGRLPLVMFQRMASNAIGQVIQTSFEWAKYKNIDHPVLGVKANEIPDNLEVSALLEVTLPQDKLQNANVAGLLTRDQVASLRWIRENVMGIGQSETMDKEIMIEQATKAMFAMLMQEMLAQAQQQQAPQPGPGGPPQPGMEGQQMPPGQEQMPPGMEQPAGPMGSQELMNQQGAMPGEPIQGAQPYPPMGV